MLVALSIAFCYTTDLYTVKAGASAPPPACGLMGWRPHLAMRIECRCWLVGLGDSGAYLQFRYRNFWNLDG